MKWLDKIKERLLIFKRSQQDISACVLIAVLIILMYGRAAGYGGDIWDDLFYLGMFREKTTFSHLFFQLQQPVLGLYSPLVTLSFYLDRCFLFSGNFVAAAHVWNLFYFIVGAWGLYALFRTLSLPGSEEKKWSLSPFWAACGVMLWAFHPQRAESVVWISERKDMLLCCCTWWAWFLFVRGYRKGFFSLGAFVLFLLSFGIKPMLLLFPAVLAVWIYIETRSVNCRDYRYLLPWTGLSLLFLIYHLSSLFTGEKELLSGTPWLEGFLWKCGNYGATAIFPIGAGPFHPFYPGSGWGYTAVSCLLLGVFLACLVFLPRYRRGILTAAGGAIISFGLLLAPVIGAGRIGNADWADRYNLLPSALTALVITALAAGVWGSNSRKTVRCAAVFFFACFFVWECIACHRLIPVWKNSESVIRAVLREPFPNYRVLFVAAVRALEQGDERKFMELSKRFLPEEKMSPRDASAVRIFRLGSAAQWDFKKKQNSRALEKVSRLLADPSWKKITLITDGFPQQLLTQAAEIYLQKGQLTNAGGIFERLSLCYPGSMEEYFYRGLALIFQKRYREAVTALEEAEKRAPRDTAVKYQLDFARRRASVIR